MLRRKGSTGFAIIGAFLFGGFMLVGTILLGHMRPTWMELDYVLPYAVGLLFGALLGLITGHRTTDEAGPPSLRRRRLTANNAVSDGRY